MNRDNFYINGLKNGMQLADVPRNARTVAVCLEAVKRDGLALRDVPEISFVTRVITAAVKQNGQALRFVGKKCRSEALCRLALKSGGSFGYVPKPLRTYEMSMNAVKEWGRNILFVPESMLDEKIYLAAVKSRRFWANTLQCVPKPMRDSRICSAAIARAAKDDVEDYMAAIVLCNVPDELHSPGLCAVVARKGGENIFSVTVDVCNTKGEDEESYSSNSHFCRTCPVSQAVLYDEGFWKQALVSPSAMLEDMRKIETKGQSIADWTAYKENGMFLCIPASVLGTAKNVDEFVEKLGVASAGNDAETEKSTRADWIVACNEDGLRLKEVPENMRDYSICSVAVLRNPDAMEFVPDKYLPEMKDIVSRLSENCQSAPDM